MTSEHLRPIRAKAHALLHQLDAQIETKGREFHILIEPGAATAEQITELFVALDTLYRRAGGSGLRLTIDSVDLGATVPATLSDPTCPDPTAVLSPETNDDPSTSNHKYPHDNDLHPSPPDFPNHPT